MTAQKRQQKAEDKRFGGKESPWALKRPNEPEIEPKKKKMPSGKRIGHFKPTLIKCLGCGQLSGLDVDDRWRTFIWPHIGTCKKAYLSKYFPFGDAPDPIPMFEWIEVEENEKSS